MILSLIVAVSRERAIGRANTLPWHLPQDLKRFKALTTGHSILMGRKTFESLPNGALPHRRNIVVSRTLSEAPGAELYHSLEEALQALDTSDEEVFVIGGGELYRSLIDRADKLYLTEVEISISDADTFFPSYDLDEWQIIRQEHCPQDERNPYSSTYYELQRPKRGAIPIK